MLFSENDAYEGFISEEVTPYIVKVYILSELMRYFTILRDIIIS